MMFLVLELNYHRLFIIYFSQIQDGDIQDGDVQDGVPCLYFVQAPLCFHISIGPAAIVEGNKDNFLDPVTHLKSIVVVVGGTCL